MLNMTYGYLILFTIINYDIRPKQLFMKQSLYAVNTTASYWDYTIFR